jgi:hypothetical protein
MKHLQLILRIALVVLFGSTTAFAQSNASALEYKVKAVVLVNFAKYVQWPSSALKTPEQPINVCLMGENPFGTIFEAANAPKEAQGRPLKIQTLAADGGIDTYSMCQILYWNEKHEKTAEKMMPELHKRGVLTISNTQSDESIISFVLKDGKVRFQIRYQAAKELGFEMSSQLLKLATVVD